MGGSERALRLSIWVSWSPSVLTSFDWKVLNPGKWIRGSLMLEGSPCPGEVREAMPVLQNCGCQAEKHPVGMTKRSLGPGEKDLPFCLVLHHTYGKSWPSLSQQHRPLGHCTFTCIHFCPLSFPLRASRHSVPDGWLLESSFGTPYVF